jgi:thymidine kinase
MFSAKTSRLLLDLERFKHQHRNVMAFKPVIDDRYSDVDIVSHMGWRYPAIGITEGADVLKLLAERNHPSDVVAVDEAFMVVGISEVLIWLYRTGIDVVVSTLDLSSTGKPFKEVEKLLPWATRVEKCVAVCAECGRDAAYTHKKLVSGNEIEIGGAELYEPRCLFHHALIYKRPKLGE